MPAERRSTRQVLSSGLGLVAALALLLWPSGALADGPAVAVTITGAGRVVETTTAHKLDCTSAGGVVTCPDASWDAGTRVRVEAVPANRHWRFDAFQQGGTGRLACTVSGNSCSWTQPPCEGCTDRLALGVVFARVDFDGDGFVEPADCDDDDPAIRPGVYDIPENRIDEDCDGRDAVDTDHDDDGYNRAGLGGAADCDDENPGVHPGARDIPGNGVDEDCDGEDAIVRDRDGDGYNAPGLGGIADCDDGNPAVHLGAVEIPDNGVDEDCSGADAKNPDRDGDGFVARGFPDGSDCNDNNAAIFPGAREIRGDGADEDCDGFDVPLGTLPTALVVDVGAVGDRTRFKTLRLAHVLRGSTITVTCTGTPCPRRRWKSTRSGTLSLERYLGRGFRPGAQLLIEVSRPEYVAMARRITVRRQKPPVVVLLCRRPDGGLSLDGSC